LTSNGLNPYYGLETFGEPILTHGIPKADVDENGKKKKEKKRKSWMINGKPITEKELWGIDWQENFPELMKTIQENIGNKISFGEKENIGLDEIIEETEVNE